MNTFDLPTLLRSSAYKEILAIPMSELTSAQDLNIAGIAALRSNLTDVASNYFNLALEMNPRFIQARSNLAIALISTGDFNNAEYHLKIATTDFPEYLLTWQIYGDLLERQSRFKEALHCCETLLALDCTLESANDAIARLRTLIKEDEEKNIAPEDVTSFQDAPIKLEELIELYHHERYADILSRVAQATPSAAVCNIAGIASIAQKDMEGAERYFRQGISINPEFAEVHNNLGNVLFDSNRFDEAYIHYSKALELKDDYIDALLNIGRLYKSQENFAEALTYFNKLLELNPKHRAILYERAMLQYQLNDYANALESIQIYNQRFTTTPSSELLLGKIHDALGNYSEAGKAYYSLLSSNLDHHEAHYRYGLSLLGESLDPSGWDYLKHRKQCLGYADYSSIAPEWDGATLVGKTLLVIPEANLIDTVLMLRYASRLKDIGNTKIVLLSSEEQYFFSLFSGIDDVVSFDELTHLAIDSWIYLADIPRMLGDNPLVQTNFIPYLFPDDEQKELWKSLEHKKTYKVGLAWIREMDETTSHSTSLKEFLSLWERPNTTFVSLQRLEGLHEAIHLEQKYPLFTYGESCEDLSELVALISTLDLVIAINSATAHIAAAMGKPCWILLDAPDWRWGYSSKNEIDWYPGYTWIYRAHPERTKELSIQEISTNFLALPNKKSTSKLFSLFSRKS